MKWTGSLEKRLGGAVFQEVNSPLSEDGYFRLIFFFVQTRFSQHKSDGTVHYSKLGKPDSTGSP